MKKIGVIFLISVLMFAFCATHSFAANTIEAESRITKVMIYPDSALLTRQAQLKVNPGEYKVVFPDIIPNVDEDSLRVSSEGSAEVKVQGGQVKKEYLRETPSEKIKSLENQIRRLEDENKALQDLKNVFMEEKAFLDSIRLFSKDQIPEDLVTKTPSVKDLDDTLKFLDVKLKENFSAVMDCELKMRDIREKINVLRNELASISGPIQKLKRSIEVDVEVVKAGVLDLSISYLVSGATWQPIYDARADFDKVAVELVSFGLVRQKTGEDWDGVEVSLSTAKPAIGGRMPYVSPWFLRPYQPVMMDYETRGGMGRAMKATHQSQAFNLEALSSEGKDLKEEPAARSAEAPVYSKAEEKGVAVVYTLAKKVDVKSDGAENKLPISSQVLKASFEYSTYPRVAPFAYLGSRVLNAKDLQLLGGRVNIFLAGDFVGTSSIDTIGPGEEFDLYLGVDENVKIKREQIEKKVDETLIGSIPSPVKKTTFKYKLTVENYKTKKAKVKIFEAMPVSEDDRIKVKFGQVSLEPKAKDWKDRKGVWLWELELEPKAKQEIIYNYTIEHPRDMQVEGL